MVSIEEEEGTGRSVGCTFSGERRGARHEGLRTERVRGNNREITEYGMRSKVVD